MADQVPFPTEEPPAHADVPEPTTPVPAAQSTAPAAAAGAGEYQGTVTAVDVAAELRLLAAVFADPSLLDELTEKVAGTDFGVTAHEAVFDAVVACDAGGMPVDVVTVSDELTRAGMLDTVGGVDAVRRIAAAGEENPDLAAAAIADAVVGFAAYADIVFDRATRRRLMLAGRQIVADAASGRMDAGTLIQASEERVFAVAQDRAASTVKSMTEVVADVAHRMAMARSKKLVGVSTGFSKLDDVTGGLQAGQMVTIAARPGMGKSVLLTQLARHIAETTGDLVPIFSYEMQAGEIGLRLLASASGVPLSELMRGQVPGGMDRIVAQESEKLAATPMLIDDRPPNTITGVRSSLRRMSRRGKIGAIGLDYVQLVGGSQVRANGNRENEVAEVSRTIKLMADEFGVPFIIASQLNRGLEQRPNKRPLLSDLRESGSLEQDSSLVIMVYRPNVYDTTAPESEAELIVAKNRNGATTTIYADWDGPQVRFRESDRTGPIGEVSLGGGPGGPPPVNSHGANGSAHGGPTGGFTGYNPF